MSKKQVILRINENLKSRLELLSLKNQISLNDMKIYLLELGYEEYKILLENNNIKNYFYITDKSQDKRTPIRLDDNLKLRIKNLRCKDLPSFNKVAIILLELGYQIYMERFDNYFLKQNKIVKECDYNEN